MKSKRAIIIIFGIVLILILVLGLTYAYLRTVLNGSEQIVKIDTLELILNETSEGINLDTAIGVSDSKGMSLTPSTFTLLNNGDKAVDYTIYLDDMEIDSTDTRIDDKFLKYNLNKNGTDSGAKLLTSIGANPNRVLDSGTIEGGETNKYSLNIWITDEVDGNYSGQVFKGKLRVEVSQEKGEPLADVLLADSANNINTTDPDQIFITGEDPNNYVWYSGKLWRAVSIDPSDNSVKLVTQWNISAIPYNLRGNSVFEGSYMEEWLNDTSVDGFLGNLREPEKFIKMDSVWNATMTTGTTKPAETTMVEAPVGLLNIYEYTMSYTYTNGYLNNGLYWWTISPCSTTTVYYVRNDGLDSDYTPAAAYGIRPSINLKLGIKTVSGDGTIDNPYRLKGDNDTNLAGVQLSTRYSGEYIRFGNDENNLYRIVSHETKGLTKIVSTEPLKNSGNFITLVFDSNSGVDYSSTNTIGTFLNTNYLTDYVDDKYIQMVEDEMLWYLGTVGDGVSYKFAKYTDTNMLSLTTSVTAKVGLLRLGELFSSQSNRVENNSPYWNLTKYTSTRVRNTTQSGNASSAASFSTSGVYPAMNLKSNVKIVSGTGTLQDPFQIELDN